MNKTHLLWILIAADVLLAFGSVGSEAFFGWTLPPALAEFRHARGTGAFRLLLLAVTTASAFVAWIGLATFWRRARALYLFASASWILLLLCSGPSVMTAVAAGFSALSGLVSGAIIGLVYFSDVARRFERPPVAHAAPPGMNLGADRG